MNWLKLSIQSSPERLDDLQVKLITYGFDSFQIEDERDFDDFVSTASPSWDYVDEIVAEQYKNRCHVIVYLPQREDSYDNIALLRSEFGAVTEASLEQASWEDGWKQYYKPTPVGKRLLIQPAWLPVENPENRAVFLNNPGMSFGTGLHATTSLCLQLLESELKAGDRVLDIGCGSGILSICALKLGAESADAVDIDPMAADIAAENGRNNKVVNYRTFSGNILEDTSLHDKLEGEYEIICSNIVADVIISLSPIARKRIKADGRWIVSGLIDIRVEEVRQALLNDGWTELAYKLEDGWGAIELAP